MLKYSPAGSEGVDSCVANCNYGSYWNGEECSPCDVDTYLGFDDYKENASSMNAVATYNENRASPKYGDGTGNSDLCIPCPTLTLFGGTCACPSSISGDTDENTGYAQCQFDTGA